MDIEYFPAGGGSGGRDRTPSVFSSRPESPTDSTDERQMLLDVERNIANLERTYTDSRKATGSGGEHREDEAENGGGGGGGGSESRTQKKGLFRYSSFTTADGANDRKRLG